MLILLLGCAESFQLQPDFAADLTEGFACTDTMVGPDLDGGVLIDDAASVRVQIDAGDDAMVVFTGRDLDAFQRGDNNGCDDVISGEIQEQSFRMAWSVTNGSITATNTDDTRSFELTDIVLTPDDQYDFGPDFLEAADFDPVELGSITLGEVAHGGQLVPLR